MKQQRKISTILFFICILIFPVLTLFSPKKSFSELENRYLKKRPSLSVGGWFDKSFMDDWEKYLSDHFIGRTGWIKAKIEIQTATGKNEINGTYITSQRLMEVIPEPDKNKIQKSVDAINSFSGKTDKPVYVLIAPTSAGIYADTLPDNTPQLDQGNIIAEIYSGFDEGVTTIDTIEFLKAHKDDYIYYRTDHHWTSLGAYYAYSIAIQKMGFSPVLFSKYRIEHAGNDFMGTYYSRTLYDKTENDIIDIYSCESGNTVRSCTVTKGIVNGEADTEEYDDIYFREFLDKKDKYSTYLGQNQPMINIKTDSESDKKLLVFKDSYAHSFIPFLTQHYNEITVLDMRYIRKLTDYLPDSEKEKYSQILFLYNSTTFSEDDYIKNIVS